MLNEMGAWGYVVVMGFLAGPVIWLRYAIVGCHIIHAQNPEVPGGRYRYLIVWDCGTDFKSLCHRNC